MNEQIINGLNDIENKYPGIQIIYLSYSGSLLHGTNTLNSDLDIKGLFIPDKNSLLLGIAPTVLSFNSNKNSKNSSEDIDIELFSVSEFLRLLYKGEANSVDLLFSMFSKSVILETELSLMFKDQYKNLLTKNTKSFIGYAMKQANLSSAKGTRLKELEDFYFLLQKEDISKDKRLGDFRYLFNNIKKEHISFYVNESGEEELCILNKKFILKTPINLVMQSLKSTLDSYGERAQNTKINQGKDFKAISHALRTIEEGIELLETGFIQFPLQKAQEIKNIKMGLITDKEKIDNLLESRINVLKETSEKTFLPEKININWSEFLLNIYEKSLK